MKNIRLFILLSIVLEVLANEVPFVEDENCLYNETGNHIIWDRLARIDFFIPWKPSRHSDTLFIISATFHISVPNPLQFPYQSIIPKNNLRFGWNKMIIENTGDNQDVKIIIGTYSETISNLSPIPSGSRFRTCGQFSVINCNRDQKYYRIPAKKDVVIPYALHGVVDRFDLYSNRAFSLELTLSKRFKICRDKVGTFTVKTECTGRPMTAFGPGRIYNVYMYPVSFDSQDILQFENFTITEFTVHNLGDEEFYLQTLPRPESNVPLWLLNDSLPVTKLTPIKNNITETTTADTDNSFTTTTIMTLKSSSLQNTYFILNTQEPSTVSPVSDTEPSLVAGDSNVLIIVVICCVSLFVILLIVGITYCVKRYRKPQQRRFETPISAIEFSTWPGLKENYVNAEPTRTEMKKTAMAGDDKYLHSTFSSASGDVTFANYNPPSLGIGEEDNYYEEYYERPKNEMEYENCNKSPDPTYMNTTEKSEHVNRNLVKET